MSEDNRDGFPSLDGITEYMVPGPGMSALEPWMEAPPASAVATAPSNGANGAGAEATETKESTETEEPQEAEPVPELPVENGAGGVDDGGGGVDDGADPLATRLSIAADEPEAIPEANGWEVEGLTSNTWDAEAEAEAPDFLQQELAPILASARRAAAEIVDRAKAWVRTETVELEQMRQLLEQRAAELAAWQQEVEPAVREVLAKMGSVRSQIDEVPELIRVSLRTLATTISSLDPTLSELTQRSSRMLGLEPLPERYLPKSDVPTS